MTDRNNNVTSLAYNSSGMLTTITDATGRELNLNYSSGTLSSISDGMGTVATYTSWWGRMETVRYPDGSGFNFYHNWIYDKIGSITDVMGNYLVSHTFDGTGRVLTTQAANNGTQLLP
jgi:YD repeat-containing protein